jgi:hypothetical protein
MMQARNKPLNEIKEIANAKEKIIPEIDTAWSIDYLDENEKVALKFGCMSIFTPKRVGNLNTICFKIRGMFETPEELAERIENLKKKYPHDPIQQFDVGLWSVDTDVETLSNEERLKQLNYAMKCHLDNMVTEAEEFEKRRDTMVEEAQNHAKMTSINNKKAKRQARKEEAQKKAAEQTSSTKPSTKPSPKPTKTVAKSKNPQQKIHSLVGGEDDKAIKEIMDLLYDEKTRGKYETMPQDKSNATVISV